MFLGLNNLMTPSFRRQGTRSLSVSLYLLYVGKEQLVSYLGDIKGRRCGPTQIFNRQCLNQRSLAFLSRGVLVLYFECSLTGE